MSADTYKTKKQASKKYIYCGNCGKYGHVYKKCPEPITSHGIIAFKIEDLDDTEQEFIDQFSDESFPIDVIDTNKKDKITSSSELDIAIFCALDKRIKFLLIRRKHTLGYIEFLRGRYRIANVDGIIFLFRQMTPDEINKIGTTEFDKLWHDLWENEEKYKSYYEQEYKQSKEKFENIKYCDDDRYLGLDFYVKNVIPTWKHAEWGFPKGRRNLYESNIECAKREFMEETGYDKNEYNYYAGIYPFEENLIGTNGIKYKHIYYVANVITDRDPVIDPDYKPQSTEVGDIGWFTFRETLDLIRIHHVERKKIITEMYMYIIKRISNIIRKTG